MIPLVPTANRRGLTLEFFQQQNELLLSLNKHISTLAQEKLRSRVHDEFVLRDRREKLSLMIQEQQLFSPSRMASWNEITADTSITQATAVAQRKRLDQQASRFGTVPVGKGIPMGLASDQEHLSDYQVLVRQCLEFFTADETDVATKVKGRKHQIHVGQVGVRCKFCSHLPRLARGKAAVYFPKRFRGIYQGMSLFYSFLVSHTFGSAAQNMGLLHLCQSCVSIPPDLRDLLNRKRVIRQCVGGGQSYWEQGCILSGLVEDAHCLRFRRDFVVQHFGNEI